MTARKTAVKEEAAEVVDMDGQPMPTGPDGLQILTDPGATIDQADVVTSDPTDHKTWVELPDGQRGWVKRERKDSVLVTLSIAGFDGETRWIHRDNLQSVHTAD